MIGFSELLVIIVVFGILYLVKVPETERLDYQELETEILKEFKDRHLLSEETDDRVEAILTHFHSICNSNVASYQHYIWLTDKINAMALPCGTIIIAKGFLDTNQAFTDDEIASVLAHEIGHIELGHAKNRIKDQLKSEVFEDGIQILWKNPVLSFGAKSLSFLSQQLFCREQEYEADQYAVNLLSQSNYNPRGILSLFEKFKQWQNDPKWVELISTHPHLDERIDHLNQILCRASLPSQNEEIHPKNTV